jgi:hypothetical protein
LRFRKGQRIQFKYQASIKMAGKSHKHSSNSFLRRKRKIRSSRRKIQVRRSNTIISSRPSIPRWSNPSSFAKGKLCLTCRCWCPSLPHRRLGIPRCRNPRVGWKRAKGCLFGIIDLMLHRPYPDNSSGSQVP